MGKAKSFSKPLQQKVAKNTGKNFNKNSIAGNKKSALEKLQKLQKTGGKQNSDKQLKKQFNGKNKLIDQKHAQAAIEKELDVESDDDFLDDEGISGSDDVDNTLDSSVFGASGMDSEEDDSDEEMTSEEEQPQKKTAEKKITEKKESEDDTDDDESDADNNDNSKKISKKSLTPEQIEIRKNAVTVFVGNLPINTRRKKIINLFKKFGKIVSIRFRTATGSALGKLQKVTGRSVIAFVDFETMDMAKASLAMNGEKLGDNILRVDLQKNSKNLTEVDAKRMLFIGNLKYTVTDDILHNTFSTCGELQYVRPLMCSNGCKGTAYVCYKDAASVELALKLNKTLIEGREIRIERYNPSKLGTGKKPQTQNKGQDVIRQKPVSVNKKSQPQKQKAPFVGIKKDVKKVQKKNKPTKENKLLAKKIAPKAPTNAKKNTAK